MIFAYLFLFFAAAVEACTAFQLQAQDGAWIYCRSMEYGIPLDSNLLFVGRGTPYTGTAPGQKKGISWKVKYGYAGMNQSLDESLVSDGMNEKGLVIGSLYLPGYAKYEKFEEERTERTIGYWELPSFLLGNCATLEEVKAALSSLHVPEQPVPIIRDYIMPLHFYIADAKGQVMILEFVGGKRVLYDNPLGVLTNSPPFEWHLTNLANYMNISSLNVRQLDLPHFKIRNPSQGTGAIGLPGDLTPPSRFIRAAFFTGWAAPQKTALDAVRTGFHILNTFDIFSGAIRNADHERGGKLCDYTQWVVVYDRTNGKAYFRMYESLQIQMADLKKFDYSKPGFRHIPLEKDFVIEEISHGIKEFKPSKGQIPVGF